MNNSKQRLDTPKALDDSAIDTSEIPELNDAFWANAELVLPANKQGVYIRLDTEVLAWFKRGGKGYQTRINQVLKAYVDSQS